MAQVQCPNCGGYKVTTYPSTYNRRTGKELQKFGCGFWAGMFFWGGVFGIYPLFGGVGVLILLIMGKAPGLDIGMGIGLLVIGFTCTSLAGFWMIGSIREYFKADKITIYGHACSLCGYSWARREDEPLPEVRMRPDLIAMGEQRL
ncbi:hypothetical protein HYR99_03095 [Candidatus Poribacteria bacterium]|nr:hypothetical protein [Candidatus Poribacteria bacterium]